MKLTQYNNSNITTQTGKVEIVKLNKRSIAQTNLLPEFVMSDEINLITLALDVSGSMEGNMNIMKSFLEDLKKQMEELSVYYPILISRIDFSTELTGFGFNMIDDFITEFTVDGGTDLYGAVDFATFNIKNYTKELQKASKKVNNFLIILTDGDSGTYDVSGIVARQGVESVNTMAQTIYIYCSDTYSEKGIQQGTDLKFQQVIDLKTKDLSSFLKQLLDSLSKAIDYGKRLELSWK